MDTPGTGSFAGKVAFVTGAASGIVIDVDLRGVFLCMKHEIPLMLKQGFGAIVNTSSGAGFIGMRGNPAYAAAKHGGIGLPRAAALGYAALKIRVNAVGTGYIDTPLMGRFTWAT